MATVYRHGECNRCGQCCGADGSPAQRNPWPRSWATQTIAQFDFDRFRANWPHAELIGLSKDEATGKVLVTAESGNHTIQGKKIGWIWVEKTGLCKDLGDGNYSLECPWLDDDPGDGTRPCILASVARYKPLWDVACFEGPDGSGLPPLVDDSERAADFLARHPLCSFTYNEVPE